VTGSRKAAAALLGLSLSACGLEARTLGTPDAGGGAGGSGDAGQGGSASGNGGDDAGQGGSASGGCAETCSAPRASTQCVDGACAISACNIGFFDCNGELEDGCEAQGVPVLAAPLARAPGNGTFTGSLHAVAALGTLRPTLRWEPVEAVCGTPQYQLQLDDSCAAGDLAGCAFAAPEVDVRGLAGPDFRPDADLPVSAEVPVGAMYTWRVRACDASARCSDWSLPRYLHVGRVLQDLNGDGYADLIAQSTQMSMVPRVEVFAGSSQFDQEVDLQLPSGTGVPTFLGDVNGDGFPDAGAITGYAPTSGQVVRVLFGRADLSTYSDCDPVDDSCVRLTSAAGGPSSNLRVMRVGDVNGDGYADVFIETNAGSSSVRLFLGAPTLAANPALTLPSPLAEMYSIASSGGVGDLDADGYADIALVTTSYVTTSESSHLYILRGGTQGAAFSPAIDMGARCEDVIDLAGAADVNADGFGDFLLSCRNSGLSAFFGARVLSYALGPSLADALVQGVASDFDINQDGVTDVLVGVNAEAAWLFLGRAGFDFSQREQDAFSALVGAQVLSVSDQNGDGLWDFVASGASFRRANGDGSTDPSALPGSFLTDGGYSVTGPPAR
jgi:hypothetical protein